MAKESSSRGLAVGGDESSGFEAHTSEGCSVIPQRSFRWFVLFRRFIMHSGSWRSERERNAGFFCLYLRWKVRVLPSFKRETDSEQSLWHSLETNTENKHKVNRYEREEKEKYRLRIASERGDDDDYDDVSDEHDSTKDCSLQSSLEGATGAKNRVNRLGLYIYGQRSINHSFIFYQ